MDMESLRMAIGILVEQRESPPDYKRMLEFTAKLHGLPEETVERLVICHLADLTD